MDFLDKIKHTIYRPDFFGRSAHEAKGGLRFYSLLLLLFVGTRVLLAVPTTIHFYQSVLSGEWRQQETILTDLYPDGLTLSIKEGTVSTNVNEPYSIIFPEAWRSPKEVMPENLLIIDTTKPIETGDFVARNTFLILGKNGFGYHDPNKGEFRIYDFRDKEWRGALDINKGTYDHFVTTASTVLRRFLFVGGFVLPFFLYAFLWVAYLAYLVFGALVVWLGAKLRGHHIGYGQAYVAGLYLLPIPFLYEFFSSYGHGASFNIPFAFTLILFIMTLMNFPKIIPGPAPTTPVTPETKPILIAEADKQSDEKHADSH